MDIDNTNDIDDDNDQETVIDTTVTAAADDEPKGDRGDTVAGDEVVEDKPEVKDEPKAEDKEKPDDKAEARIPKSRFDEVNQRMKDAEAHATALAEELAQLKKAPAKEEEPAPAVDLDAKEEAYAEALLEGDSKKAAGIRREINAEIKRQASHEAESKISAQMTQREQTASVNTVVAKSFEKYPFLDDSAESVNKEAIAEVVEWRDFYVNKGHALPVAIQMAVDKIGPMFAANDVADDEAHDKDELKTEKTNVRRLEAIKRGATAANAQPAQLAGVGERASAAGRVDVAKMTDDEFDNLPMAERKRLRGD